MADRQSIINQTLRLLAEPPIAGAGGNDPTSEDVETVYEPTLLALLEDYNWIFATKRRPLQRAVNIDELDVGGYQYAYRMPTDLVGGGPIRLVQEFQVPRSGEIKNWEVRDGYIWTNQPEPQAYYIYRVDESLFPPSFEKLFVYTLALTLCEAITTNLRLATWLKEQIDDGPYHTGLESKARNANSKKAPKRKLVTNILINGRRGFGFGSPGDFGSGGF